MEYSVYDAIEVVFSCVEFIVWHDIEALFNEMACNRIRKMCVVMVCAYQDKKNPPSGFVCSEGYERSWGTGLHCSAVRGFWMAILWLSMRTTTAGMMPIN